jgi:hypothetical protein
MRPVASKLMDASRLTRASIQSSSAVQSAVQLESPGRVGQSSKADDSCATAKRAWLMMKMVLTSTHVTRPEAATAIEGLIEVFPMSGPKCRETSGETHLISIEVQQDLPCG